MLIKRFRHRLNANTTFKFDSVYLASKSVNDMTTKNPPQSSV